MKTTPKSFSNQNVKILKKWWDVLNLLKKKKWREEKLFKLKITTSGEFSKVKKIKFDGKKWIKWTSSGKSIKCNQRTLHVYSNPIEKEFLFWKSLFYEFFSDKKESSKSQIQEKIDLKIYKWIIENASITAFSSCVFKWWY